MAPKAELDPVTAEYDVYLTQPLAEQIYLLQYPNRPRNRPYSRNYGTTPQDIRIKPNSGYLEMDVQLDAQRNFNKSMGLKWGEAAQWSKEYNRSGTYGLAAGLTAARPRAARRDDAAKDAAEREREMTNGLDDFDRADSEDKVFSSQILGGQVIRHDSIDESGKPVYFVGAFEGNQLHLSRVSGTVQMRPQFHHLDAEDEMSRTAATSRTQPTDGAEPAGPAPVARAVQPRFMQEEEKGSLEARIKTLLHAAEAEPWVHMDYIDEDDEEAFRIFHEKLMVRNTDSAPALKSSMDNDAYLDAISAPKHEIPTRRRRPARRKGTADLEGDDVEGSAVNSKSGNAEG